MDSRLENRARKYLLSAYKQDEADVDFDACGIIDELLSALEDADAESDKAQDVIKTLQERIDALDDEIWYLKDSLE